MVPILRRLVQEPPQSVPLELRVSWHGHVLVLRRTCWPGCVPTSWPSLQPRPRGGGASPARRLVAHPTGGRWIARSSTSRSAAPPRSRCSATRGGRRSVPSRPFVGLPIRRCCGGSRARSCLRLNASGQRQLSAANGDTLDWTAADGALLDELANLLGPVPEAEDREVPIFLEAAPRCRS